jgi:HEAT repeat protein
LAAPAGAHHDVGIVGDLVEPTERRRRAAVAGHTGDAATARELLDDPAPAVRATALGALARLGAVTDDELRRALADPDAAVRRRAATEARHRARVDLVPLLDDVELLVAEAAAWALGERAPSDPRTVTRLSEIAVAHDDALVRESAVAALGAIGDDAGLPAILQATGDKPAVRRRAVLALAPFDGPDVDAALERARHDRDWQVRQAAEDLLS